MAYSRFTGADVYVFMSSAGHLECCGCRLGNQWEFGSTQAMVDHLAEHRAAGHDVPVGLEAELWEDDQENWVDYRRCDVDGCDKRATCGSPTINGYVSTCGIEHGQRLGAFLDLPALERQPE